MFALLLSVAMASGSIPEGVRSHLWVGPLRVGLTVSEVERVLGSSASTTKPAADILCYNDGDSSLVLWFADNAGLYQIVVAHGLSRGCSARIPMKYGLMRDWRWAGGVVSRPPNSEKLRADSKGWIPPGTIDTFWHFRLLACDGSIVSYDETGNYSFEIGPVGCEH